jgi:two-component system cell cycle sensor histidine kinase/response regulator CckA
MAPSMPQLAERPAAGIGVAAVRAAMADVLLDHSADGMLAVDAEGCIVLCNRSTERLFGWKAADLVGRPASCLLPASGQRRKHDPDPDLLVADETTFGTVGVRQNGTRFPMEVVVTPFAVGAARHTTWVVRDVSERAQLEAQLRQSQKMDAMGQLAGGVAHDFNNLLTVINGWCETLAADNTTEHRPAIDEIRRAATRAGTLTAQLLAFGRKAAVTPRVVDLNDAIADVAKMLARVIGEDIALDIRPNATPRHVRIDTGQLSQVLVNLAVNARDAMPEGGRLSISTRPSEMGRIEARPHGVSPGDYVCLTVSDTGHGMTHEVAARAFEPFFSTKGDRGTGLGLATVYGIVRQAGGTIFVRSRAGEGATFSILLPSALPEATQPDAVALSVGNERGTESVLVVEDEPQVRAIAVSMLRSRGYRVLVASTPREAMELARVQETVDLVLTDVVMPEQNGPELVAALRAFRPQLPALYVSGYAADAVTDRAGERDGFLQKPYTGRQLGLQVRQLLDGHVGSPGAPARRSEER